MHLLNPKTSLLNLDLKDRNVSAAVGGKVGRNYFKAAFGTKIFFQIVRLDLKLKHLVRMARRWH